MIKPLGTIHADRGWVRFTSDRFSLALAEGDDYEEVEQLAAKLGFLIDPNFQDWLLLNIDPDTVDDLATEKLRILASSRADFPRNDILALQDYLWGIDNSHNMEAIVESAIALWNRYCTEIGKEGEQVK